ncbi:MAG: MFS transporter, partial [Actinobacteria bacterium]|nr:MFS transporter [Actinomycetota bacterium]
MADAEPLAATVQPLAPPTAAIAAPATGIFRSLNFFNARLYFLGLLLSNIGSWLQGTAMAYLVYRLTGRASDLGYNVAFQFLPMLFLGTWAGGVADRFNRRTIMLVTQTLLAVQALVLGVLDITGHISLGLVWTLSFFYGVLLAIDNPARRGLITELVPIGQLSNAMSMNTAVMTGSRVFGAALAALLVGLIGTGWLFVMNGVSYAAMI